MKCEEIFAATYGRDPERKAFAPYRICPIGAHSDHNLGKITGFAIDKGIHFAYGEKRNGVVEVLSVQFPKRAQWHIASVPEKKQGDWADYLRGATLALKRRYPLQVGLCGVFEGTMPVGGLSSSASVTLCFLSALCAVNRLTPAPQELIDMAYEAEKNYVGVSIGKLDPACEVLGQKGRLLYLDTRDDSYELIPEHPAMKPFDIMVFFSGLEHSNAGSRYNMRVDELRAGVYALMAYAGLDYGKFEEACARAVPREIYESYKNRLPGPWARRCEHWYTEYARVEAGAKAWRRGDIEEFGRLCFESGRSSIVNWESGAPEQIRLYEIMRGTEGIYGGRFCGAGFKGCCLALTEPEREEEVRDRVSRLYLKDFPHLADKYAVFVCHPADGVSVGKEEE